MSDVPKIDLSNVVIPKSVDQAFANLTDKPTKEIGDIFNDLLYLSLGNIHFYAEKKRIKHQFALEEFKTLCEEKYEIRLEKRRAELAFQSFVSSLEYSKRCKKNIIAKEMFANLLASDVNVSENRIADSFSPKIIKKIKKMSPLEAGIFASLEPDKVFPICEIIASLPNSSLDFTAYTNVLLAEREYLSKNILENRAAAISSLEKLGVIRTTYDECTKADKYLRYTDNRGFKDLNKLYGYTMKLNRGILFFTPLGIQLWNVCCKNLTLPSVINVPTSFQ